MSKEVGSTEPHVEQDALNEEQTVETMENAANSLRNDVAGNLELHEERSKNDPARATQNPAAQELSAAPNPPETKGKKAARISRRRFFTTAGIAAASLPLVGLRESVAQEVFDADNPALDREPLVIKKQGSFFVGGTVITAPGTFDPINPTPAGQTFNGDHAYAQFQIPLNARNLPLVMWHGAGQSGKTYESTPDGREGYQTIFLRRGWAVYILDQARRGRAARSTETFTITPTPGEQGTFVTWRLGIWPNLYPNSQFPSGPAALEQFFRQMTPSTGGGDLLRTGDYQANVDAVSALFAKIGPAVLITHSASGGLGWLTGVQSPNVKAIIAYEPSEFLFPEGELPPPTAPAGVFPSLFGTAVSGADFAKLTKIPIQLVYADHIPTSPSPIPGLQFRLAMITRGRLFVEAVNRHGGDASLLHLPEIGIFGNTHFAMSDLNNLEIADLLSDYLREKGLDKRGNGH
jgi:hypothetical protein